ncbi:Endonuclease V [Gossypium australe]|uniref:Endonuclease V n=1 Tax=Gossypium australe TaxID=47621 RepID=A0A5B6X9T8_9ROSI|nr:Endonuclease V [Gossypium australe]
MEGINEKEEAQKGSSPAELGKWAEIQDTLKKRVITVDDFPWRLASQSESEPQQQQLKYVGGVDVSFSKEEPSMACGSLVVLDLLHDLRLVYQEYTCLSLDIPYVPGFLAFREAPILLHLLAKMKKDASPFYPQVLSSVFQFKVLMVDGNGLLHPRGKSVFYSIKCPYQLSPSLYFEVFPWPGFGLASHLGVIANIPTIGVGKNLHHVDGLTQSGVRKLLEAEENKAKGIITLRGNSGFIWGAAMRSEQGSLKPVFVSVGHRVSLETAIEIVNRTCKFRVPEPIRQPSTIYYCKALW